MLRAAALDIFAGARCLCRGLNLDVREGELWAVLGCNGSGKSTLLQALAGLRPPAAGQIEFAARAINAYSRRELARGLGLLLQSEPQEYWGSLADYVSLGRFPHAPGGFGGDAAGSDAVARALALTTGERGIGLRGFCCSTNRSSISICVISSKPWL